METSQNSVFMTGKWQDLIIRTFSCSPKILEPYLPKDVEIDLFKDKAHFSMVAFTFSDVKFFGAKIPFHQKFGQINFRFYAKSKINGAKGVVFIKELAPKAIIAFIANKIYNEPFFYKKIKQNSPKTENFKSVEYTFNSTEKIKALIKNGSRIAKQNSLESFIVDRYIAFVPSKSRNTYQYKINHTPWKLHEIENCSISEEILTLLPQQFHNAKIVATYVVDGSYITVEKGILQKETIINAGLALNY